MNGNKYDPTRAAIRHQVLIQVEATLKDLLDTEKIPGWKDQLAKLVAHAQKLIRATAPPPGATNDPT